MLRFGLDGLCDSWFMYLAHTYMVSVDANNPQRVFAGFLEFRVDYNTPLASAWALTNYWGRTTAAGAPEIGRDNAELNGLFTVTTLTNNRTYALAWDAGAGNLRRIVELTTNGLRTTSIGGLHPLTELEADGAQLFIEKAGGMATFQRSSITGFDGNYDPVYTTAPNATNSFTDGVHQLRINIKSLGRRTSHFTRTGTTNRLR
jgi:hypothetical protein